MNSAHLAQLRRTILVVLTGLLASAAGGWVALSADHHVVRRALRAEARLHAKIIEARFSELEHPVLTAADFVASDPDCNPTNFLRFAAFAAPHAPIVQWLGWAPLVPAAGRAEFEAGAREYTPGFRIIDRSGDTLAPAPARPVYLPLFAVRDFRGRSVPLGLDLAGDPALRRTAEAARDEGHAVATRPLPSLDRGKSGQITMLVAPIYRNGIQALKGTSARRQMLQGYVVGAYGVEAVLGFVTADVASKNELISFSRPNPSRHFGQALAAEPIARAGRGLPPGVHDGDTFRVTLPLSFLGQSWTATFAFTPQALARRYSYAPFGWFGAGLLLTAALGTMTARGETRRLATERLVETRTQELSIANEGLRQSAETLQATFSATPLAIIVLDPDRRITQWNRGAERIFGYAAAEVLGKDYFPLMVPQAEHAGADALFRRICDGELLRDVAAQRLRRDGSLLDVRVASNPLRDAEGRLRGVVFASQDVTENRKLEEQLRQAQKMEAIGQLTGGVAHDFNNLLGTAITSLDLLRDRMEDDGANKELANNALDALLHGADLVRRLLAFARRQPLQPEHVRLNGLVLEAVRLLRPLLGDAIEIALDLGDGLWPVLVDRAQFETALINLATNGRDAMPQGGRLDITTRNLCIRSDTTVVDNAELGPGDYVVVEVSDSGTGIPPAIRQRIFEPFFTTKGKSVGTGLGLSTVLGFIKQSGGHIEVESEPGHGSRFRLYLSRHVDPVPADSAASAEREPERTTSRGETVLVVEDNAGLRHILLRQLTKFGYDVLEAEDATRALTLMADGRQVDLLFTDVMLPCGMTGIELAAVARTKWPMLKVLLTSGFPEALLEAPAAAADFPLISKPYREEELARALREALAR